MIGTLFSSYTTVTTYLSDETPTRVKDLVEDLEARLPYLPPKQQEELILRIAAIKTNAKATNVTNNCKNTGVQITKVVAGMAGGPIGLGVATFATYDYEKKLKQDKNLRIAKLEKVAGQRRVPKGNRQKSDGKSAITSAARSGIQSYTMNQIGVKEMTFSAVNWSVNTGSSFFFG